jgi:hypothetical protein
MRTCVSYMGHHNPQHAKADIAEMALLKLDDLLVAAQENDFAYFNGKLKFTPQIAKDDGLRPIVIFWGALNLFGGGRSSQFLLEHPEGFQVRATSRYVAPWRVRIWLARANIVAACDSRRQPAAACAIASYRVVYCAALGEQPRATGLGKVWHPEATCEAPYGRG